YPRHFLWAKRSSKILNKLALNTFKNYKIREMSLRLQPQLVVCGLRVVRLRICQQTIKRIGSETSSCSRYWSRPQPSPQVAWIRNAPSKPIQALPHCRES